MRLANQKLAKLKEAEDIILILWRGLAVFKVCDSWETNTQYSNYALLLRLSSRKYISLLLLATLHEF